VKHALASAALLALSTGAAAHDFWIEPTAYRPSAGKAVGLRLRVGEGFRGDPVPRDSTRIDSFLLLDATGRRAVPGTEGADPAGLAVLRDGGTHVVAYRSRRNALALPGDRFDAYLAERGLDRVLEARARATDRAAPVHEVFSRCAKALLAPAGEATEGYDRVAGLRLELVPEADPFRLPNDGELPVRLLFDGTPLEGVLVAAIPSADPSRRLAARTDAEGRVVFRLEVPGAWLVKAVHMVPAPDGLDADWESLWASLTFEAGR
jgi:ABC-type Co2+ transport system, periplasmic component